MWHQHMLNMVKRFLQMEIQPEMVIHLMAGIWMQRVRSMQVIVLK